MLPFGDDDLTVGVQCNYPSGDGCIREADGRLGAQGELRTHCPFVAEQLGVVVTLLDHSSTLEVSQEDGKGHLGHKESSGLAQVTHQPRYPGWLSLSASSASVEVHLDQTGRAGY